MAARYFVPGGTGNWNSTTNWSATDGGAPGASFPAASDTVFLNANSGVNTLTINVSSNCTSIDCTGFTGTLTGGPSIVFNVAGSVTFVAGMTLNCTGTIEISAASTLTWGGLTWGGNMTFLGAGTKTFASDVTILGNFFTGGAVTAGVYDFYIGGNFSPMGGTLSGTITCILNGTGTWGTNGFVNVDLIINSAGTITISNSVYFGGAKTLTYIAAGSFITTGSTLFLQSLSSLDLSGCTINNVTANTVVTLLSDLNLAGTLTSTAPITISGAFNIKVASLIATSNISGTSTIIFNATGTWSGSGIVSIPMEINTAGTLTITGTVSYRGGTFTYRRGKVIAGTATLNIAASCTLVNIHKIVFGSVIVLGGQVVTMNEFFSGSANIRTRIASTNTTNYIITFQDGFEKISKFVRISNATITNRGQLLVITDKANANTAGAVNLGVRYTNTVPNGISKSNPSANLQACFGIDDGFCAEPLSK